MNQGLAAGPTFAPHHASKPHRPMHNFTRRELLRLGAATAAAELTSLGLHGCGNSSGISPLLPSACSKLTDIEHVVILTQENRSSIITLEATAAYVDSPIKAWHSGSPTPRTPRTLP